MAHGELERVTPLLHCGLQECQDILSPTTVGEASVGAGSRRWGCRAGWGWPLAGAGSPFCQLFAQPGGGRGHAGGAGPVEGSW